ncbi:MFS transporter [Glycomyces halotolerans]
MTETAAETRTHLGKTPRRALITLCATQITSWGVLFYAFPVLSGRISVDTGWSTAAVTGAFSAGLAVSAAAGVPVGHLLDRHGPRSVMTAGSVLAVAAVAAIAWAPNPAWFLAAWALAGIAQAAVFYKPAFAALTVWYGDRRVRALTVLTLVAGLSSTVFAPLAAALADHLTWRETYLVLGLVLAAITIPAHAVGLSPPWPSKRSESESAQPTVAEAAADQNLIRTAAFGFLAAAMALATFTLFAATFFLVPLLNARGADTATAAWALGLCGAGQLFGRIGYGPLTRRTTATARTVFILTLGAATIAATVVLATPISVVFAVVIVLGAARGAFTLLEATAVSDRWGTAAFGHRYGVFSAPSTIAIAVAPAAGALIADRLGSYPAMFALLAALMLAAAALAVIGQPRRSQHPADYEPVR